VLDAFRAYVQHHGYPPTLTELAEAIGVQSVNAVSQHLQQLEAKGLVTRVKGRPRAIRLIEDHPEESD
jgi:repressor LexA